MNNAEMKKHLADFDKCEAAFMDTFSKLLQQGHDQLMVAMVMNTVAGGATWHIGKNDKDRLDTLHKFFNLPANGLDHTGVQ